ncbi:hypothetical protein [Acinetobacter soli]|uniref:hypothetical protein n=1 Tax=Acinetobacter soli TaxID=487316 RepID=UPI0012506739|nr:hypothetical protein [Acinetobacter soli]
MKVSELLKNPEGNQHMESALSGHIMTAFTKVNRTPPIPRWQDNKFVYVDPIAEKYAKYLREGMVLMAVVLDSLQEGDSDEK